MVNLQRKKLQRWVRRRRVDLSNRTHSLKYSVLARWMGAVVAPVLAAAGKEQIPDPRRYLYIEPSARCNLKCRFCAYRKKEGGKIVMDQDTFTETVEQALDMGYRTLGLTPCTGDVFSDRYFFEKLEYLEKHPRLESYAFYTNFVLPSREQIKGLCQLEKLQPLSISIYGHDEESFVAVAGSNANAYRRLVANLETLAEVGSPSKMGPQVQIRTHWRFPGIDRADSDLCRALVRLRDRVDAPIYVKKWYDNWGGMITNQDVEGLDLRVIENDPVPKRGPCALIFSRNLVMADGKVNACACRDVEGTLALGNIHDQPLKEILSLRNPTYAKLIERQEAGDFDDICKSCTAYQSIYRFSNPFHSRHQSDTVTLEEFRKRTS